MYTGFYEGFVRVDLYFHSQKISLTWYKQKFLTLSNNLVCVCVFVCESDKQDSTIASGTLLLKTKYFTLLYFYFFYLLYLTQYFQLFLLHQWKKILARPYSSILFRNYYCFRKNDWMIQQLTQCHESIRSLRARLLSSSHSLPILWILITSTCCLSSRTTI